MVRACEENKTKHEFTTHWSNVAALTDTRHPSNANLLSFLDGQVHAVDCNSLGRERRMNSSLTFRIKLSVEGGSGIMGMAGTYWTNAVPAINISGGWSFLDEGRCGCPITDPHLHLFYVHFCTKEEKLLVVMADVQNCCDLCKCPTSILLAYGELYQTVIHHFPVVLSMYALQSTNLLIHKG